MFLYSLMNFDEIKNFNPSNCISGRVMRLSRITANIFRKYLKPFGVTDSQTSILFLVSKHEKGLTQTRITEILQLEKSSLSRNLKRLVDQNYLMKNNSSEIVITQSGKKLVISIIPEWEKAMAEIRSLIGDDGEESLNKVLTNLINKI